MGLGSRTELKATVRIYLVSLSVCLSRCSINDGGQDEEEEEEE